MLMMASNVIMPITIGAFVIMAILAILFYHKVLLSTRIKNLFSVLETFPSFDLKYEKLRLS